MNPIPKSSRIRPSLPPVFFAAGVLWASCAGAYAAYPSFDGAAVAWGSAAGCLCCAITFAAALCRRRYIVALLAAALAVGMMLGFGEAGKIAGYERAIGEKATAELVVKVTSDVSTTSYGSSASGEVVSGEVSGKTFAGARLRLSFDEDTVLHYGEVVSGTFSVKPPTESLRASCRRKGQCGVAELVRVQQGSAAAPLSWVYAFRESVVEGICALDGGEAGAVLAAMVCGYRTRLYEGSAYGDYQAAGTAHLIAVSGAHLSIICGIATALLGWAGLGRRALYFATVVLVCVFAVFAGLPVSTLRAGIMVICSSSAFWVGRRPAPLNAVGLCLVIILCVDPVSAVSISLVLSAASTVAIILFSPLLIGSISEARSQDNPAVEALALTLSASILTIPICAAEFGQISLVSPLANVLVAPLFTMSCSLGFVGSLLGGVPVAGVVLTRVALLCVEVMNALVGMCARLPFACVPVELEVVGGFALSLGLGAVLYILWPKLRLARVGMACACVSVGAMCVVTIGALFAPDRIVMMDVGQGDAFILSSQGQTLVIDTGNQDALLRAALARQGIWSASAVLITHPDSDHCDSLDALAYAAHPRKLLVAAGTIADDGENCLKLVNQAAELGLEIVEVRAGDTLSVGRFTVTVLWPSELADSGGNNDSICLLVEDDVEGDGCVDFRGLFVGDAEAQTIAHIGETTDLGHLDVYKVSHHGSKTGLSDEVAAKLVADIALVSVGEDNRYGHPAKDVIAWLEGSGARIYRTDEDGDVVVKVEAGGTQVE